LFIQHVPGRTYIMQGSGYRLASDDALRIKCWVCYSSALVPKLGKNYP